MKTRLFIVFAFGLCQLGHNFALAQDEPLGRLFYTPSQRAALNANVRTVTREAPKPKPVPPSMTLNGVITRSDGERTVWIDGQVYHRGETGDLQVTIEPDDPGAVEIKVEGVPYRRSVRVGQRLDPASGETLEAFETRQPDSGYSGSETASDSASGQ
ncbi:MAG: hypothetical protein PVH25_00200 [Burkholderiales bacterium]|jgi:hypothetical protein